MTRSVPAAPKKCQEVPEDNAVIQNKGDVVPSCECRQCSLQDIEESKYAPCQASPQQLLGDKYLVSNSQSLRWAKVYKRKRCGTY